MLPLQSPVPDRPYISTTMSTKLPSQNKLMQRRNSLKVFNRKEKRAALKQVCY